MIVPLIHRPTAYRFEFMAFELKSKQFLCVFVPFVFLFNVSVRVIALIV